jgi:S-(hydroxymethyl)glutathione dehydrogenase/alcohol dehydrogenase
MDDEDAVLLTDALATGYFGAQLGDIAEGDVVAVFGAGPVGLFAAKSAWFMGAGRVIAIDHLDYRLEKARSFAHAETYNFTAYDDIVVHIKKITDYLGSDVARLVMGAYGPMFSAVKFGDAMNKGLTLRMNQCPVKRQWPRLFDHIRNGYLKPSEIVTHRFPLDDINEAYHTFSAKLDNCIKPLIVPNGH